MGIIGTFWRSIENPSTSLADPAEWFYDAVGGGLDGSLQSDGGIKVSYKRSLQYSPVWRGINLLAGDVARLPLFVYKRVRPAGADDGNAGETDNEGRDIDEQHPAYRLLRWKANSEMTAFVFKRMVQANAILDGNGLAYIVRRGDGTPVELIPLYPGYTRPVRVNGGLWYYTMVPSSAGDQEYRWIPPADMLHIRGLGYDGLSGYPLSLIAKQALGLGMAGEKFANKYFLNSGEPRVVLELPAGAKLKADAIARLRESWNAMHQGLDASHRVAILEEGMKLNSFSHNARDAQLLELRKFQVREVANFLNVPPHKLGDDSKVAYNSLESENASYLNESLDPWLVNWEEEVRDKLFSGAEKDADTHFAQFDRLALLRPDAAARSTLYHQALQDGWMNRDEVRARENLNPLPASQGKKFFVPLNMALAGDEDGQQHMEFLRETVGAFIADGTVSDVIANATDIKKLVADSGLPANTEYTEPWLPVIADNGELVSGDTIEDPEGDVVGGDVVDPVADATADVAAEAVSRMVHRLGVHACRAAKGGKPLSRDLIDRLEADHRGVIVEAWQKPCRALSAAAGVRLTASWLADEMFAGLRSIAGKGDSAGGLRGSRDAAVLFGHLESRLSRQIVAAVRTAGRVRVDLRPSKLMRVAALDGLSRHVNGEGGDDCPVSMVRLARKICRRRLLSQKTVRAMADWHFSHAAKKPGGIIEGTSWHCQRQLAGGEAGAKWAAAKVKELDEEDED